MIADGEAFFAVCVVLIAVYCTVYYRLSHSQDRWPVPRVIWTYVASPVDLLHPPIQRAIESWKHFHPTFTVHVLTEETYRGFVRHFPTELDITQRGPLHHPVFHDWFPSLLSLYLLEEHGGVWLDPTTVLKGPLTSWLFPRPALRFVGVTSRESTAETSMDRPAMLHPSLIASVPHDRIIRMWRDEFTRAAGYPSMDKYVESRGESILLTPPVSVASKALPLTDKKDAKGSRIHEEGLPWHRWDQVAIREHL